MPRPTANALPRSIRILTYNVLADRVHVEQRVPPMLALLERSNADIIALQEVAP